MSRRGRTVVLLMAGALLLSGCGATIAPEPAGDAPNAAAFPLTLDNCGEHVTFRKPPQRVVTSDIGITEMMFALGLGNRMAGHALPDGQRAGIESSPWKAEFARVPRIAEQISKEVVRGANADLVFGGWKYGFGETQGVTPASLGSLGIDSYVLTESCRNGTGTQRGIMPPLDALYTDLRNLGTLFGVPERAEALIADYERTVAAARASTPAEAPRPKVFLYDSGTSQPTTSGRGGAASQIITEAGGSNIFGDLDDSWTSVSWEAVVRADPEVILINDYASDQANTVQDKINFLTSYPPLSEVDAIRNKRFIALPYAALVESPRNPAAVQSFAEYLRGRTG